MASNGYTYHGHPYGDVSLLAVTPRYVNRCGGIHVCRICRDEVAIVTGESTAVDLVKQLLTGLGGAFTWTDSRGVAHEGPEALHIAAATAVAAVYRAVAVEQATPPGQPVERYRPGCYIPADALRHRADEIERAATAPPEPV
jgi:hypothetical protein